MDKELHKKIRATIDSIDDYEIISSEDLKILFLKEGLSNNIAKEASLFLPIIFCKKMLPKVNFSQFYIEVKNSGSRVKHKFTENSLYNIVAKQTQNYFNTNPDSKTILKIASLSAEFQAINKLLLNGGNLEDVRLTDTMIIK